MEHTNLFLYETEADFRADYPEGKLNQPVPGVAYIRGEEGQLGTLHTNREITTYPITIHSTDKNGVTVAQDRVIQTNPVLDGNNVKMNVVAEPVEGYKPRHEVEKVTFTSASTEHTIIYLAPTSYTITVNHICSGESITDPTEIVVEGIYEEEIVRVTIEPENVPGYTANSVTISVSGDMEYDLEYEAVVPEYEFVDLGLPSGTLWATKNIGAADEYDFGNLYAFGEIETKNSYTLENYKWYNSSTGEYTKYGSVDGKDTLDPEDDVAAVIIGNGAHMASPEQWYELVENTTVEIFPDCWSCCSEEASQVDRFYITYHSLNNDNYVTFPLERKYFSQNDNTCISWFSYIYYSYTFDDDVASYLGGNCEGSFGVANAVRYIGIPVRPVIGEIQPGPEPQIS